MTLFLRIAWRFGDFVLFLHQNRMCVMIIEERERYMALQDRVFSRLFEQAEIARFTPKERQEYEDSKKEYWDYYSTMETAHKKGLAKGRAEGEAKGRAEGHLEDARRMKADNMPAEQIAKYTGLSIDEITEL